VPESRLSPKGEASLGTELTEAVRETAGASLRYYARLGGLAFALVEAFVPSLSGLRPAVRLSSDAPSPRGSAADSPETAQGQTIVIEAASGRSGLGVFVVENTTARKVSGPVGISAFADASGREVQPEVRFAPDSVSLEPGDQVLVQVAAAIDDTLEPGVRYGAEISIPELSEARIPLVVRRRGGKAGRAPRAAGRRA
jgi:hypothetical protein